MGVPAMGTVSRQGDINPCLDVGLWPPRKIRSVLFLMVSCLIVSLNRLTPLLSPERSAFTTLSPLQRRSVSPGPRLSARLLAAI